MSLRLSSLFLVLLALPGCPAAEGAPADAAPAVDAGRTDLDASRDATTLDGSEATLDGGEATLDGGEATLDGGEATVDGGGVGSDAGDPGSDAGDPGVDAGDPGADAGTTEPDACVPPPCPAPPPDCTYVGATACTCGTLVCGQPDCGGACGRREFCDYAASCSGLGSCRSYDPTALCPDLYDPVCGCDGTTYSNECEAVRAGVDVDYAGECVPMGECVTDLDCGRREYCATCRGIGGPINVCLPTGAVC